MLIIRLMRMGKKGESKYRLVVKERRDRRDGKAVEILGWYEKRVGGKSTKDIQLDRVKYWMSVGAKPSETVKKLLGL
ncbi:MAG: 30S ribosomal protein S16 [Patescibacteria group bacterium]|nr:30S ribosomal protein S16 [Patescibacteria group bacterium]MDE2590308.1 30S ribosomal protein S16 [Patescibacteria group bacterium]